MSEEELRKELEEAIYLLDNVRNELADPHHVEAFIQRMKETYGIEP